MAAEYALVKREHLLEGIPTQTSAVSHDSLFSLGSAWVKAGESLVRFRDKAIMVFITETA
jgi:hypothetical protein